MHLVVNLLLIQCYKDQVSIIGPATILNWALNFPFLDNALRSSLTKTMVKSVELLFELNSESAAEVTRAEWLQVTLAVTDKMDWSGQGFRVWGPEMGLEPAVH